MNFKLPYRIEIDVQQLKGKLIKDPNINEYIDSWCHLFFLTFCDLKALHIFLQNTYQSNDKHQ